MQSSARKPSCKHAVSAASEQQRTPADLGTQAAKKSKANEIGMDQQQLKAQEDRQKQPSHSPNPQKKLLRRVNDHVLSKLSSRQMRKKNKTATRDPTTDLQLEDCELANARSDRSATDKIILSIRFLLRYAGVSKLRPRVAAARLGGGAGAGARPPTSCALVRTLGSFSWNRREVARACRVLFKATYFLEDSFAMQSRSSTHFCQSTISHGIFF